MRFDSRRRQLAFLLGLLIIGAPAFATAPDPLEGFTDPSDGQFDVSDFLLNKRGFLLNPIVITEPAIGYGGGATLLFFHGDEDEKEEGVPLGLPPSISFALGGATESKSWLAGGGHFGSFRDDSIRYLGAAGYGSFNIDFYIGSRDIEYGLDGFFVLQELQFRVKDWDLFLGGRYVFSRLESEVDFGVSVPSFIPTEFAFDGTPFSPFLRSARGACRQRDIRMSTRSRVSSRVVGASGSDGA